MSEVYETLARVAAKIDRYRVAINKGAANGVEEGQEYIIFSLGKEITDPVTGEDLGKLEMVRGRATVTNVQNFMSTLESSDFETEETTEREIRRTFPGMPETVRETDRRRRKALDAERGDYVKLA